MYDSKGDMVYRYRLNGKGELVRQLVGHLLQGETVEQFVAKNKRAFI